MLKNPLVVLFLMLCVTSNAIAVQWIAGAGWEAFIGAVFGLDNFASRNPIENPVIRRPERPLRGE